MSDSDFSDFIPSDLSVRIAYAYVDDVAGRITRDREAAFDRWLQCVITKAWNEGYEAGASGACPPIGGAS
jgi:hypothetical protein